jgi:hypothetical protein
MGVVPCSRKKRSRTSTTRAILVILRAECSHRSANGEMRARGRLSTQKKPTSSRKLRAWLFPEPEVPVRIRKWSGPAERRPSGAGSLTPAPVRAPG